MAKNGIIKIRKNDFSGKANVGKHTTYIAPAKKILCFLCKLDCLTKLQLGPLSNKGGKKISISLMPDKDMIDNKQTIMLKLTGINLTQIFPMSLSKGANINDFIMKIKNFAEEQKYFFHDNRQ